MFPPDSYVKPPAPQNVTLSGHRSLQTELVKTMSYWSRVHPESTSDRRPYAEGTWGPPCRHDYRGKAMYRGPLTVSEGTCPTDTLTGHV